MPTLSSGGASHLEPARLEREVALDAAFGASQQAALELGQVEVERDAIVVELELAAHDHQPLDRDAEPAAAAAAAAELRDVVAARPERRRGERVDPQREALEPDARQRDVVAAPRREARAHAHGGDLEEGRGIGSDPRDAQPPQLELGRGEPHADALERHGALEDARERRLDHVRAPVRRAPERVERGRDEHERDQQELAPARHGARP